VFSGFRPAIAMEQIPGIYPREIQATTDNYSLFVELKPNSTIAQLYNDIGEENIKAS
jgi:hypothetical protein